MNTSDSPSGHELKVRRVTERVKSKDLAAQMEVSPGRVAHIEREAFPSAEVVARYLKALAECAHVPHTEAA